MGEGIAIGAAMASLGLSLFVLTRAPLASFQRDIKTSIKRLERDWNDYQERLEKVAGRVAKQRGLLEAAAKSTVAVDRTEPVPDRPRSRRQLFSDWKVRHAQQNSVSSGEPGGPVLRGAGETSPGSG